MARLTDLTVRARENRLKLDDLQGGTFTISNLARSAPIVFTAILNPPQAAIWLRAVQRSANGRRR